MKSLLHTFSLLVLMSCFFLIYPNIIIAGVDLPWSTTYNCPDWKTTDGADTHCDGMTKYGDIACQPQGYLEQITSAANNPNGGGGKGQRHWVGDGINNLSGGTEVSFNTPQPEIWVRWYIRYPLGFTWTGNQPSGSKLLYFHTNGGASPYTIFQYNWMAVVFNPRNDHSADGTGWTHIMGGSTGDGLWHYYEVHLKVDTNGSNGVAEFWVDGVQLVSVSDLSYGGATGISRFTVGSNTNAPANGSCTAVDYDDMAISNTGYIGPIGSSVTHNVTCSVGSYGLCSCNSPVNDGVTTTCTATPNSGYQIASGSSACGGSLSGNTFTTGAVTSDCVVTFTTSTAVVNGASTSTAVVNGACGLANGQSFTSAPTANLCSSCTASSVSGAGPWTWTCNGSGGGTNASCSASVLSQTALFQENFDNNSFASRGWYDVTGGTISTSEHIPGSTSSLECRFLLGGTKCTGGVPGRMAFTATDEVYLSYWVKHSSNWQGSGLTKTYHPHIFYLLTNLDTAYVPPAYTYMTAYIDENLGYPMLSTQDGKNIDETKIGLNLVGVTENRSTAGCNGTQTGIGQYHIDCYVCGATHCNDTQWRGLTAYFFDANEKILWHHVEAYFKLNSISSGIGQADGILRYWHDGQLVIDHNNVIIRTGENPTMQFNQILLSPYIGDGSPVDQTFWIDNLIVATSRLVDNTLPSPPGKFEVK